MFKKKKETKETKEIKGTVQRINSTHYRPIYDTVHVFLKLKEYDFIFTALLITTAKSTQTFLLTEKEDLVYFSADEDNNIKEKSFENLSIVMN